MVQLRTLLFCSKTILSFQLAVVIVASIVLINYFPGNPPKEIGNRNEKVFHMTDKN